MKGVRNSILFFGLLFVALSCSTESTPVYQLTTAAEPLEAGSVIPSESEHEEGEIVTITAIAQDHWIFNGWVDGYSGSENPASLKMDSDKHVVALFIPKEHPVECETPFAGTLWVDPNIILSSDPSTFIGVTYEGQDTRQMHDRRHGWITEEPYLFGATYDDGLYIEIQVNPEFENPDSAKVQAEKYGWYIGQIPTELRKDVETAWIHKGNEAFGGGNNNLQIHTDFGEELIDAGLIGEVFLHEGAHTSLDAEHASSAGWLDAQAADNCFISDYAHDFPMREDIAESFPLYVAIRYRSDRIPQELIDTIKSTIPNRIAYFDKQGFDMYPISVD